MIDPLPTATQRDSTRRRNLIDWVPLSLLVGVISVLGLGFACAGLVAVAAGQASGIPDVISELGMESCSAPCYLGLAPGQTRWQDAPQVVQAAVISDSFNELRLRLPGSGQASFFLSSDEQFVGHGYAFLPPVIEVGWLLSLYGEPCGISLYPNTGLVVLHYPFALANVSVQSRQFSERSIVNSLQFNDPTDDRQFLPDVCADTVTGYGVFNAQWHGVARLHILLRQFGMINR